jgi:hypothetical protein
MLGEKVRDKMPLPYRRPDSVEPNHRQEMALERIEFAIEELATVLLAQCHSHVAAGSAIADVRKAVAPVVAGILLLE